MIPGELVVITNFATITSWEMRNTFMGLILPSVTSVFYIYLLKENFEQVPDELYRAAKVDGTSDFKFLWKVMIPMCWPTLITIIILKVIEVLEFLRMAAADYGRSRLLSGQRRNPGNPGKRLRTREYPGNDGGGCGGFHSPDPAVLGIPEKIMAGVSRGGLKG